MTRKPVVLALLLVPVWAAILANVGATSVQWSMCIAGVAVVSLLYVARPGSRGRETSHPNRRSRDRIALLALAVPVYVAFQLLPLPLPLLRLLSPRRAQLTDALGAVMPAPRFAPLSVDPAATTMALTGVMACVLCFFLVRELTYSSLRRASWRTVFPLMAIAVFEAAFALWQASSGEEVAGTYWNRNHLAGLLEMVLPLCVAYAVFLKRRNKGALLPMVLIAIIFLGVVASGSKGGYVATLAGLLAMGLVVALTRFSGIAKWATLAALPVIGIVAFALFGNQDVLIRLTGVLDTADGMTGEGRVPIWADSLRLLAAYPVFGSGLGTYFASFVAFQTTGLSNHWTHAHNDYVESATDLGVIGLVLFLVMFFIVAAAALRLTRERRQSGADLLALGCLGSFAAIGLHSAADFNLYIPANALTLAWIAGIAAGIPVRQGSREVSGGRKLQPATMALAIVTLVLSAIAIVGAAPRSTIESNTAPGTLTERLDAVRRSPAYPFLWLDVAEALKESGRTDEAKASVTQAMALGEHVPRVTDRAATLFYALGDHRQAVALMSRELQKKGADPDAVFGWFVERGISNADVLAAFLGASDLGGRGLQPAPALSAFLRYLMLPGTCPDAAKVWHELVTRYRPDPKLAGDYVNFLSNDCYRPDDAAAAWVEYAKRVAPGYRESEWVFNGGFEMERAQVASDWRWNERTREAEVDLDPAEKFSGSRSLRIAFRGASRAVYEGASQQVGVSPGVYRFSAAVRTQELSSADGIFFHITGGDRASRVDVQSAQSTGTTSWHTISSEVIVPEGVSQIRIQIVRRPGQRAVEEGGLKGTAWVDDASLTKVR